MKQVSHYLLYRFYMMQMKNKIGLRKHGNTQKSAVVTIVLSDVSFL